MPRRMLENTSASSPDAVIVYDNLGNVISAANPFPVTAILSGTANKVKIFNSDDTDNSLSTGGQIGQKVMVIGQSDPFIAGVVPVLDAANSSSALLGASATFAGAFTSVIGKYSAIQVSCAIFVGGFGAPNVSTLYVEFSSDGITANGDQYTYSVGSAADGNPVRASIPIQDNYYRVRLVNGTYNMIAAGGYLRLTAVLHPIMSGNSVRGNGLFIVGGDGSSLSGPPINIGADDGLGSVFALRGDPTAMALFIMGTATAITGNGLTVMERGAASATLTNTAVAASSTTLAASASARRGVAVFNDSTEFLYLKYGSASSTTSFTFKVAPGEVWTMHMPLYTGIVTGIAAVATGTWRITTW